MWRFVLSLSSRILLGFQDKQGNAGGSNVRPMSTSGTIYLTSGDYMSVFIYSDRDKSYRVQSESGWGCHMLRTRVGFHAHLLKDLTFGRGWNNAAGWLTSNRGKGDEELYSMGGGISSDGHYQVRQTGYYLCAVQVCAQSDVACSLCIACANASVITVPSLYATAANRLGLGQIVLPRHRVTERQLQRQRRR